MGNYCQNGCNPKAGQLANHYYFDGSSQYQDQPSSDYAIFKGTNHYEIPCIVNHVLQDYEKISFKKGSEQGVQKDGYYYIRPHQVFYVGQWKHGKPHGKGQVCFSNGSVLQGWFQNGVCNGPENLHVMEDGTHYFGSIRNNMFDGKGKMVSRDGYKIQGQWKDNKPNGFCKQIFQNGDSYQGIFIDGEKQTDQGVYKWKNHRYYEKYQGGFSRNKIHGNGALYKVNGDIITGYFGPKIVSQCKYRSVTKGIQYQGKIVQGQLDGHGNITFKDGRMYEGQFKNGNMHGKGCIKDQQGLKKQGFWFKGRRVRNIKNMDDNQIKLIIEIVQNSLKKTKEGKAFKKDVKQDLNGNIQTQQFIPYIIEQSAERKIQGDKYIVFQFGSDLLLITNKQQSIFEELPDKSK